MESKYIPFENFTSKGNRGRPKGTTKPKEPLPANKCKRCHKENDRDNRTLCTSCTKYMNEIQKEKRAQSRLTKALDDIIIKYLGDGNFIGLTRDVEINGVKRTVFIEMFIADDEGRKPGDDGYGESD